MKPTCLPDTHPPEVSPNALFLVHYSLSCTLTSSCSLNQYLYADDTQLFLSFLLTPFDSSIDYLQNALGRVSYWMTLNLNLLTLNSSKTEFLLTDPSKQLAKIHSCSLNIIHSARNLGFIFDEHFTFSDQLSSVSKSCYYHIRQLHSIGLV